VQVYLAAAMTNPDRDLATIQRFLAAIEAHGHTVPTRHVADPRGKAADRALTDAGLARRDLAWLAASDALVAEVSTPSHGVGIEVMAAVTRALPVLLLRREGAPVSRLLLGLPGVATATYRDAEAGCAAIAAFLGGRG
jgi:2'-deoxynucleoside 5'-phosphate N-hydrolase